MIKSESITIDGAKYTIAQLGAMRAIRLSAKLASIIGPALAKAAKGANGLSLADIDMSSIGDAVDILTQKCTPDELENIVKEFLFSLEKDGKDVSRSFDIEFSGKLMTVFKLLQFAFEVNYGDFFDAARGWSQKSKPRAPLIPV